MNVASVALYADGGSRPSHLQSARKSVVDSHMAIHSFNFACT